MRDTMKKGKAIVYMLLCAAVVLAGAFVGTEKAFATESETTKEVIASVTFDANGGVFQENDGKTQVKLEFTAQDFGGSKSKKVYKKEFPTPVKAGYELNKWVNESTGNVVDNSYITVKRDVHATFMATWKIEKYEISYELKGGSLEEGDVPEEFTIESEKITLPNAQKPGYFFGGWYTNPSYTGQAVTEIPKGSFGNVKFYAKWVDAAPAQAEVTKAEYKNNQLTVTVNKIANAKGYELLLAKDKKFLAAKTVTYRLGSSTKFTLSQLGKGTYYLKVRAYAYDEQGKIRYGKYSQVKTVNVTSKVKEYKATSKSAKITSAKAVSTESVSIKATINKRVSSSDDFYYLVKVNPTKNTVETVLEKTVKAKKVTFDLSTEDKVNVVSKFGIAIKQKGKYKLISKTTYITNPEKAARNTKEYYTPISKKGIHGATDANIGAKHTLANIDLNELISTKKEGEPYVYNGKTYYFKRVQQSYVSECNESGIAVTMVVFMKWSDKNKDLIYPSGRTRGKNFYALNTVDEKSRETLEAAFSYLGEAFSKEECFVSNWILGNEINSPAEWNYAGNLTLDQYSKTYAQAFQMLSYGIKSSCANARIFVPLDNAWGIPISQKGWNGKTFLKAFDKALEKEAPKTAWNLAYHAYSYPLTAPAYESHLHLTKKDDTPYVGMYNIEVLTKYIKKHYGAKTRIILSEQGYTAAMGEEEQAASIAYGYYKAEFNSMIDAYIIRSQYDNATEVAGGLSMGLSSTGKKHRQAYTVFKYMDTPKAETYTKKYLKTMGAKSWKSVVPGYSSSKLKKMK